MRWRLKARKTKYASDSESSTNRISFMLRFAEAHPVVLVRLALNVEIGRNLRDNPRVMGVG